MRQVQRCRLPSSRSRCLGSQVSRWNHPTRVLLPEFNVSRLLVALTGLVLGTLIAAAGMVQGWRVGLAQSERCRHLARQLDFYYSTPDWSEHETGCLLWGSMEQMCAEIGDRTEPWRLEATSD